MLDKIAERHDEWVSMALAVGANSSVAEDIVQEAYIRLYKYRETASKRVIMDNGNVSPSYMFATIRNTFNSFIKEEGRYVSLPEFPIESRHSEVDYEYEVKFDRLMTSIRKEVGTWGVYHSKMFNLYFKLGMSMREIANAGSELTEERISLTHIFNIIGRYKKLIAEKFSEDFRKLNSNNNE